MNRLDIQFSHRPRFILTIILIAYVICGSLFARLTPPWQAPDEPAHYNYIAHIAKGDGLPVLSMGDFDMDYISQIVGKRFPPELSVEPLRYEFYQPPLYYLSAVPIYQLAGGMRDGEDGVTYGQGLTVLRFYGLTLGLLSLLLLYACLSVAFPEQLLITLGATAFAATLPMHVAMTAAVNNDTLAILLLLASSLMLLRWMRDVLGNKILAAVHQHEGIPAKQLSDRWTLLSLGLLLGLGLLTKIYAYAFLPVCASIVLLISWRKTNLRDAIVNVMWMVSPAFLLGLPLWLRNMSFYGILDPLGLTWHDAVVVGQATTTDWIAKHGSSAYWERMFGFTFRSFWGVFGWLGLFWDWRLYMAVRILGIAVVAGLVGFLASPVMMRPRDSSPKSEEVAGSISQFQKWVALFFTLTFVTVLVSYGFYNLKFVQHQGRYFFWGLLPISTAFALGWRQLMHPGSALWAIIVLCGPMSYTLILGDRNPWTLLIILSIIFLLMLQILLSLAMIAGENEKSGSTPSGFIKFIPDFMQTVLTSPRSSKAATVVQPFIWAAPLILLFCLCIFSVFSYVIPQLSPPVLSQ